MTIIPSRLDWFLPLRLATYVVLFAVVVLWMGYPQFLQAPFVIYSVLTLSFAALMAARRRITMQYAVELFVGLHFLGEILIESGVIYATGGSVSPFSAILVLTVASGALAFRLAGTLAVATLASGAYAFTVWLGAGFAQGKGLSFESLQAILTNQDKVFYSVILHTLIFYLVAFISGYLAGRLRTRDRQLADTSLELRKARLETDDILRHLNSGLMTVDANGKVLYFNRAAERILGYREQAIRGRQVDLGLDGMSEFTDIMIAGIRDGIEYPRREVEIINRDGVCVPIGVSTSALREEDGALRGVIAIFSDLTEAKILESKIRTADRLSAIGELSASMAHEIRNPLAAISGSVEVLSNELTVSGEEARLMELIVKESDRLTKLLNKFLLYARIDRPAYNRIELCHIVNDVIEILYHHASMTPDVKIGFESDDAIVYAIGDEDLLKQLLINLAVNACESFEGKGGELTFRLASNQLDNSVEIYVQDTGPGIPTDVLKRMYEPFYSTKKQGTGLGLAIVHRIVEALSIDMSVDSQPGEGTTFLLVIPTVFSIRDNPAAAFSSESSSIPS